MKTLIEAVEAWIDDRITMQVRLLDAARIEELERRIKIMNDSPPIGRESATDLSNRIEHLERRVELLIDESDTADDVDSRLNDLECSMEEKVDSCDVDDKVESALSAQDLPDVYSIEVMIETKVMDAVREELDATDFKITVER